MKLKFPNTIYRTLLQALDLFERELKGSISQQFDESHKITDTQIKLRHDIMLAKQFIRERKLK